MYLIKIDCQNADSCKLISKNSHYYNNFIGYAGGVFNLNKVDFSDTGSTYESSLAITGGTMLAQNSKITISNCYYY